MTYIALALWLLGAVNIYLDINLHYKELSAELSAGFFAKCAGFVIYLAWPLYIAGLLIYTGATKSGLVKQNKPVAKTGPIKRVGL